jgi:molybdate/tungstate transport system substrate-binding protein
VGTGLFANYTLATLRSAPHPGAAAAFISFMLSARGRALLRTNGVTPLVPALLAH